MTKYDEHNVKADLNTAYRPIYDILKKLEMQAEKSLKEFTVRNIDGDVFSIFISELSDIEQSYEELISLLKQILQDTIYESRIAKETMDYILRIKELFDGLRIHIDNIQGFIKPGIDLEGNPIFKEMLEALNSEIKRLREALAEKIKEKIDILYKEQQNYEMLLREEDNLGH